MRHKGQGFPSKSWLVAYLKRYENQRVSFELAKGSSWWKLCVAEGAFREDAPILVSGVFCGLMKRPKGWPDLFATGTPTLYLAFRSLVFRQGDAKAMHPLARNHHQQRKQEAEFELSEIRGLGLAERLNAMVPRLGNTPGRLSYSEGSSERGFPSTKELASPPRGSDFFGEAD